MLTHIAKETKQTNLVFSGGVALNSVINGQLMTRTPFTNVFIFPAAGDDGGAVGAALYAYHHVLDHKKRARLHDMFLGPSYTNKEILTVLSKEKIPYVKYENAKLYAFITHELLQGKVIGWFEGRAEFGPRALGHRSILADPKNPKMKTIVNSRIKFREQFRPFAPVVLSAYAKDYYASHTPLLTPYMLATTKTKPKGVRDAAATTHNDQTSRIQTIDRTYTGRLRPLLEAFYKKTKRPILLNTSFNLKGEPIVHSIENAIDTFKRSGLDILVLENYVLIK